MISIASSIKFRKQDGLLPSFDNTMVAEEDFLNSLIHGYCQSILASDSIDIQVRTNADDTYDCKFYVSPNCHEEWVLLGSASLESSYTDWQFHEYTLTFSGLAYSKMQFKVEIYDSTPTLQDTWISEPVEVISDDDDDYHLQIEYYNYDENNFEMDYTTGIAHLLRVPATLKDLESGGEVEVYDNLDEITKLRHEVKRIMILRTQPIPRYLAEKLIVAVAHDKFFINEVEWVAEELPEIANESHNLVVLTQKLSQRNIIGLNTHDLGFDCNEIITTSDGIVNRKVEGASGGGSFSIPAGYAPAFCHIELLTGSSGTFKMGLAPATWDVIPQMNLDSGDRATVSAEHFKIDDVDNDYTLYYDLSGTGATFNVYLACVRIKETE